MYMEFLKGSCEKEKSERCEYCVSNAFCCSADIKHIPKPYPDAQRPGLHYLPTKDTPTVGRSVDDFHPRVQLKAIFREDNSFFDNPDNIKDFSQKYVVIEREADGKSDNESSSDSLSSDSEDDSEEEDCVLAEIGISSSEEEEESTEEEEMIASTENFNVNTTIVYTRSGRIATRIQT